MEIIGACIVAACLWYAQKPTEKKKEITKKPDITVEIVFNNDYRKRDES